MALLFLIFHCLLLESDAMEVVYNFQEQEDAAEPAPVVVQAPQPAPAVSILPPSFDLRYLQLFPETDLPTVQGPTPIVVQNIEGIELVFRDAPELLNPNQWVTVTEGWLRQTFQNLINAERIAVRDFSTTITLESQTTRIVQNLEWTTMTYTQSLQYSALPGAQSTEYYVKYPFTIPTANAAYLITIQFGIPSWGNVEGPIDLPLLPGDPRPPSPEPTPAPTRPPTLFPTASPTRVPTRRPTRNPSFQPTFKPVIVPTTAPVPGGGTPPVTETEPPVPQSDGGGSEDSVDGDTMEAELYRLTLTFQLAGNITNPVEWENLTETWFESYYETYPTFITDVSTSIKLIGVEIISQVWSQTVSEVIYNQNITYVARPGARSPEEYAILPFQDPDSKTKYGKELRSSLPGWQELKLDFAPPVIREDPEPNGEGGDGPAGDSGGIGIGVVIGIAIPVVLCCCVGAGCAYYQFSDNNGTDEEQNSPTALSKKNGGDSDSDENENDDAAGRFKKRAKRREKAAANPRRMSDGYLDPSTAESEEYGYGHPRYKAPKLVSHLSLTESGGAFRQMSQLDPHELSQHSHKLRGVVEEESEEDDDEESGDAEMIEIIAPPGRLGVVIDTPDQSYPIVHEVKSTSPIINEIFVGDTLLSIDDFNVRGMTALKVSKMISRKAQQPTRKLVVIRPIGGGDSTGGGASVQQRRGHSQHRRGATRR